MQLWPVFQGSEYKDRHTMKKQTTVKVTAMTSGTFRLTTGELRIEVTVRENEGVSNLERSWVEGEAIPVDEHPQGCQGDEEPASEGDKVEELVDLPRE